VPTGLRERELLALSPGTGIRTGGVVEHQRPGGHWGYRQDCFLADLSLPSRTIRAASTPDWIRPRGGLMRRLTWRECAALQGFPSQWVFEGQRDAKFRLVGNAVQTHMATAVGVALLGALRMGPTKAAPASPPWPEYFARRIRGAAADHRANVASRVRHLERRAS
jgi:DNA (cytosine-5)-methyltransferase 1